MMWLGYRIPEYPSRTVITKVALTLEK